MTTTAVPITAVIPTPAPTRRAVRGARRLVALATVALVALAGCAEGPGTAAVVDGRVISERQVQQARAELDALLPNPVAPGTVAVALVVGPYFLDAAAENGVGVSDREGRELAAQIAQQTQGTLPDLGPDTLEILRFTLASEELFRLPDGAQLVSEVEQEIQEADIRMSPRYGDFDQQTGQLVQPERTWLGTARP